MTFYNPHLLGRRDLIEGFVARQPLLDDLLDDLRRGGQQHHLLIGGRGSGKTTLLLRLAAGIEDDEQLAATCVPLRFPEEQYNISRPSDFWMNALDALVDALEQRDDRAAASKLEASIDEIGPLDEPERAARALAVLEGWVQRTKRMVVLLVDNLDLVLDRLSDELWALREVLSVDNRLVMVAASSRFLEQAIDYQSPFYDFFHVHELGPLSEPEARGLVLSLAARARTPRVAEVLANDPGRFKALLALTGGTPRTLALLHTVLALDTSDRVEQDLERLLDQLTPYYKARFDDLPAQSQVILDKVALHWHPMTAAECQAVTHLEINTVSAQLNRLVKSGLLAKVALPGPSKLGFLVSERFFNIWYLMRASRRSRRRLSWFVEFLRLFYGEEGLRRRAEQLVASAAADRLDSPAKLLAFASVAPDPALRSQLELRAIAALLNDGGVPIREVLDLEGEDLHLAPVVDRVRTLREVRARVVRADVAWPAERTAAEVAELLVRQPGLSLATKVALSRGLEREDAAARREAFEVLSTLVDYSAVFGGGLSDAISTGALPSPADVRTLDELQQAVALAAHPLAVVVTMLAANEQLSDEIISYALPFDSLVATTLLAKATQMLSHGGNWPRARHLALLIFGQIAQDQPLNREAVAYAMIVFLRACVARRLTAEAIQLLSETGLAERWAPLNHGLHAIADDNRSRLDGLAPEVRSVAGALFDELRKESSPAKLGPVPAGTVALISGKRKGAQPADRHELERRAYTDVRLGSRTDKPRGS